MPAGGAGVAGGGGAQITLLTPDPRRLSPFRRSGHSAALVAPPGHRSQPPLRRLRRQLSAVECSGASAFAAQSSMRALALWALCARLLSAAASLLPLEAEQLRASVGGFAVMNCHLDFPFGNEIPYHLQWDKDVSRFLRRFDSSYLFRSARLLRSRRRASVVSDTIWMFHEVPHLDRHELRSIAVPTTHLLVQRSGNNSKFASRGAKVLFYGQGRRA